MTAGAILPDAGRSVVSSWSSSWSRSRRGPSRRCTTMSTVDSTPPQLSSRTCGIVSISSVVYLMWITQTSRRSRPIDVTAGTIKNAVKYHARLHSAYTDDDAMQCNTTDVVISYFFTIDVVPGSRKMQNMTFIYRTEMLLIGPTIVSRRRNFMYSAQHSHNVVVRNLTTAML